MEPEQTVERRGRKKQNLDERYPGLVEKLGTVPDTHLALEYGITTARVWQLRKERGISAVGQASESTADPNYLNRLFSELREDWRTKGKDRTYTELAELLGVSSTSIADWAAGTSGRRPPWSVLLRLAGLCRYQLMSDPSTGQVWVVRGRKLRPAAADWVFDLPSEAAAW